MLQVLIRAKTGKPQVSEPRPKMSDQPFDPRALARGLCVGMLGPMGCLPSHYIVT